MSWWVSLVCPHCEQTFPVEEHSGGATHAIGGEFESTISVTYNYGKHFAFDDLNGAVARDVTEMLTGVVAQLDGYRGDDYWKPTEGNVKAVLERLLAWAKEHPEGKFVVH